ncbi:MAG: hypothetical protein M1826_000442 [Phylliscum demangeonii]|nr:MAG: hypothetical protein M1826_000442 [Phylliscum demangeonii]
MTAKCGYDGISSIVSSDSSLSPVPEDLDVEQAEVAVPVTAVAQKTTVSGRTKIRLATPGDPSPAKKRKTLDTSIKTEEDHSEVSELKTIRTTVRQRRTGVRVNASGDDVQSLSIKAEVKVEVEAAAIVSQPTKRGKVKQSEPQKTETTREDSTTDGEAAKPEAKLKRRRRTKAEIEAESMPLAPRTLGLRMLVGAHVSAAQGIQNSVTNSVQIGGNAFALFLKSQRKWKNAELNLEHVSLFKANCNEHKYDAGRHILPHGSYLVNLAQKDPDKATQAYDCFVDDLMRCDELGIGLYNFHPGSTGPHPRGEAIGRIAAALNHAHKITSKVTTLLETMTGRDKTIGTNFEDLRDVIAQVEDKARTAGYDLRSLSTFNRVMEQFDQIIGLQYLKALHLNDSKAPFVSYRDLHQNIGLGFLGLRAFHNVMNDPRLEGLPLVLETPIDRDGKEDKRIWADEIKLLESLIGMDPESEGFRAKEQELADQGADERTKYQAAFDKREEKERRAAERGPSKRRRKRQMDDTEDEEGGQED